MRPRAPSRAERPALLFLVGYRGTGKTTTARLLAEALGWGWADADDALERQAGRSIRQIFAEEGESGFRRRETAVLEALCGRRQQVIATGGGVVLAEGNRRLLRQAGRVVWLTADAETIWRRLQADPTTTERRPALTVGGPQEVRDLLQTREPLYRACADWAVDTSQRSPSEVADAVLELSGLAPRPAGRGRHA